jgi:hypothetical protein
MKQKKSKTASTETAVAAKSKTQTLGEFKSWLEGVEEMQADNWAPDLTQWRRIRERIDNIVETAPRSFKSGGAGPSESYEEPAAPRQLRAAGPSLLTPAAMGPTAPPPSFMTADPNQRAKAPNIDTSAQPYASSLE